MRGKGEKRGKGTGFGVQGKDRVRGAGFRGQFDWVKTVATPLDY